MSKTTVNTLVSKIKRRIDYDITDSDLDTLVIDGINDSLHLIKQYLMDYALYDEISAEGSFDTVASQAYVDIATEVPDLDEIIVQSERTNDRTIQLISYADYKRMFPDPTASSSNSPDVVARFNNRLYYGPTPSTEITIYFDYIKLITEVAAGDTLPFENKYDPLIIAMVRREMATWLDSKDMGSFKVANALVNEIRNDLITFASKNIGMNRQTESRGYRMAYGPQQQLTAPIYGFGVGGFGYGGFGE